MIIPGSGYRGGHVFVSNGVTVFDYHGYSDHHRFVAHHFAKLSRIFEGWTGRMEDISDAFWTDAWFLEHCYRRPEQFLHDPCARARSFISRFVPDPA
jgi:hypothetical protein